MLIFMAVRSKPEVTTVPDTMEKCPDTMEKCREHYRDVRGMTGKIIQQVFGGLEQFCATPFLPYQKRFYEGRSGYLNGVKPEDVSDPVMRGQDEYGKTFVTFKNCQVKNVSGTITDVPNDSVGVETLFEQYPDNNKIWASGHHYSKCHILNDHLIEGDLPSLAALLQGESIQAYCKGVEWDDGRVKLYQ